MRSLFENKRLVLLLAFLALGALTVLAISLNGVPFREGQRFAREESAEYQLSAEQVSQVWSDVPVWKQIVVWTLLFLIVILVGLLISPQFRRRFFLLVIRAALIAWAVYFALTNFGDRLLGLNMQGAAAESASADPGAPLPVFEPPQISPTFSYLISFAVALLWLAVFWGLYRSWRKYQRRHERPLEEIARIARSSLDDLSSGRNSSDVIINCYLRMSDVVSSRRQLYRTAAMTPAEFAVRLEQAGLPGEAVTRLTRLFEAVRYGERKSAPRDVTEAVSCLKTILQYCGEPA